MRYIRLTGLLIFLGSTACSPFKNVDDAFHSAVLGDFYGAKRALNKVESPPPKNKPGYYFKHSFASTGVEIFIDGEDNYPLCVSSDSLSGALVKIKELAMLYKNSTIDRKEFEEKHGLKASYLDSLTVFFQERINYCDSLKGFKKREALDSISRLIRIKQSSVLDKVANAVNEQNTKNSFLKGNKDSTIVMADSEREGDSLVFRLRVWFRNESFGKGYYKDANADSIFYAVFDSVNDVILNYAYHIHFYGVADSFPTGETTVYDIAIEPSGRIFYQDVYRDNGEREDVTIALNNTISNFELAFLRAYNAMIIFERATRREANGGITAIDYEKQRGKSGFKYRGAGCRLIIAGFFEDDLVNVPQEDRDKVFKKNTIWIIDSEENKDSIIPLLEAFPMDER